MTVTFWGVRGSFATSGAAFRQFGGNTTCIEIEAEGERVIIDAGTGLRPLGEKLAAESRETGRPIRATMVFTHLHWDHIQGFPFFGPAFNPATQLTLFGPCEGALTLEGALTRQMESPNFPVPLAAMRSAKQFHCIKDGDVLRVGAIEIRARALCHPQGSLGYRFDAGGKSFCFATDTEHLSDTSVDEALLDLARGADLFAYDAQYTPDEYAGHGGPSRKGWGHSTYAAAVRAAKAAGAGRLGLIHHDPAHDDDFVNAIERAAQSLHEHAFATREGLSLEC